LLRRWLEVLTATRVDSRSPPPRPLQIVTLPIENDRQGREVLLDVAFHRSPIVKWAAALPGQIDDLKPKNRPRTALCQFRIHFDTGSIFVHASFSVFVQRVFENKRNFG
jgi:hypothetical protein